VRLPLATVYLFARADEKEDHLIVGLCLGAIRAVVVALFLEATVYALFAHSVDDAKVSGNTCTSLASEVYCFLRQQFGVVIGVLEDMIDSAFYLLGKTGVSLQVSSEPFEEQWFILDAR